jgi:threonine/homoserine/homoserine lactone efflux protein
MAFFLAVVFGLVISIIGIIIPGMLNMTIAKISVKENKQQALRFALGAVVVVFFQAFLGTYFAKFLDAHPVFSDGIKKIGTFIFIAITVVFIVLGKRAHKQNTISVQLKNKKNRLLFGMALSAINMLAIPWYAFTSLMVASKEWFYYDIISILLFSVAAAIGTYVVFYWYAVFFKKIEHKLVFLVKNINFLIAFLTGLVAISSLYKMYFQ